MFQARRQGATLDARMSAALENIDLACLEARNFLQEHGLQEHLFAVMLGMRETLANAVIHGSQSDAAKDVFFRMSFDGASLTLEIEDQGPGHDWRGKCLAPPVPASTTGRGLAILIHYFDTICFNDTGAKVVLNKNCTKGPGMSTIQQQGENAVISPETDIVASVAQQFREKLKGLVDSGVKELVVDLAKVEMIDSIGMGLLIATHNSLTKAGGKLALTNASPDIFGLLRTMRLDKHFQISGRE